MLAVLASLLLVLHVLAAGPLAASTGRASTCATASYLAPCKTADGVDSRCIDMECAAPPPACPANASELQNCDHPGYPGQICGRWNGATTSELRCMYPSMAEEILLYDACGGKANGQSCTNFQLFYRDIMAVYTLPGFCQDHLCRPPQDETLCRSTARWNDVPCYYEGIRGGHNATFYGVCDHHPRDRHVTCVAEQIHTKAPATPIAAFDSRPGVQDPANISAIDFCNLLMDGSHCVTATGATSRCIRGKCWVPGPTCDGEATLGQFCGDGLVSRCSPSPVVPVVVPGDLPR